MSARGHKSDHTIGVTVTHEQGGHAFRQGGGVVTQHSSCQLVGRRISTYRGLLDYSKYEILTFPELPT